MAVTSAKEFLDLLEKSGLLDHGRLAQARSDVREGENATTLAKRLVETGLLTDWQGAQLVAGRSSFTLGKYKLIRLLGRGGMGGVFLAEHVTMHRRVALKTISRDFGSTSGSLEQFLLEARTIAALDHPNIVQAYSFDQEGGRFFLVMEFVDGRDLEQIVESEGPLEGNVAADYIRQAAEGLQHGHERKIIHCDIKPSNLLLNDKGVVKIVDMGMSRLQDPDKAGEGTGGDQILGSVDYLAPEQALESKDFDHRADIYSLGCTLYFLLTGRPPFPEGSLHEKLMKHQTVEPAPVTESRSDLSEKLVEVCEKMMAKEPAGRYQSAAEVSKALAKLPLPKRRAKPAAPLKKTTAPSKPQEQLPVIDVGDSSSSVMARITPRAGSAKTAADKGGNGSGKRTAARKPKFLETTKQRMIAGSLAAGAILVLLAIFLPFMLDSNEQGHDDDWLVVKGQQPGGSGTSPPIAGPDTANASTPEKHTLVFDFETGDLQGWKVVEGKFDYLVSDRATFHNTPNEAYNKQGKYHLTTLEAESGKVGADKMTGTVESPVFVLDKPEISMLVGGGSGNDTYVAICTLEGEELRKTKEGQPAETMRRIQWKVPQLVGEPAFLRVVDRATGGWGHITLDDFRADGRLDAAATEKRFAALAPKPADSAETTSGSAVLIKRHEIWQYLADGQDAPDGWTKADFDASGWKTGAAGFGYGDDDDRTKLDMKDKYTRVYIRKTFDGKAAADAEKMILSIRFDDAFVAYLNGKEVARANVQGSGKDASGIATREPGDFEEFEIKDVRSLLQPGKNVFALEGHNRSLDSSDFSLDPMVLVQKGKATTPQAVAAVAPVAERKPDPTEVKETARRSALQDESNLVFLNMDEGSGKLLDESGNEHHGEVRGDVTYNQPGKQDGAVGLNGGHLALQGSQVLNHGADFTWTAWIKTTNGRGTIFAFTGEGGKWPNGGKCLFLKGGKLHFDSSNVGCLSSQQAVNDGAWHLVAVTAKFETDGDKDTVTICVDGKQVAQKSDWNVNKHNEGDFVLKVGFCNDDFGEGAFRGLIDDVTVWNRVLKPDEIFAIGKPRAATVFGKLGKTGNLPPIAKGEEPSGKHVLGEMVLTPEQEEDVRVELLGSAQAICPPQQFGLQYDNDKEFWMVNLFGEDKTGAPTKMPVAAIAVRDQKILFHWAPGIVRKDANRLLNCGLEITVDGRSRFLPLGRIEQVEPVVIDLFQGGGRVMLPEDRLPKLESLRLEIARLDGGFPEHRVAPGTTVAPNGEATIVFDQKDFPNFWLYLVFNCKSHPKVEVAAVINYEWEPMKLTAPRPFKAGQALRVIQSMMVEERRLVNELTLADPKDGKKLKDIKNRLQPIQEKLRKFKTLSDIYAKSKNEPVKLQFGVFSALDDKHGVPLMVSIPLKELEADESAPSDEVQP